MYTLEHKLIGFKIYVFSMKNSNGGSQDFFVSPVFKMVYVNFFGGNNSRVYPLKILVKKVVRGDAVQINPNFPAKSLSI